MSNVYMSLIANNKKKFVLMLFSISIVCIILLKNVNEFERLPLIISIFIGVEFIMSFENEFIKQDKKAQIDHVLKLYKKNSEIIFYKIKNLFITLFLFLVIILIPLLMISFFEAVIAFLNFTALILSLGIVFSTIKNDFIQRIVVVLLSMIELFAVLISDSKSLEVALSINVLALALLLGVFYVNSRR